MKRVQIDRQINNHKILQVMLIALPAVDGWNSVQTHVCVCGNSVPLLLQTSSVVSRSGHLP